MQRLFRQQSEGDRTAETPNRRRGQALVSLIVGGAEAPGSATTTPLVNLVIGQHILENFLERHLDPDTPAVDIDRDDPDYRCESIDGKPISPDEFADGKLAQSDTADPSTFAEGKLGFAGQRPAILRSRQQAEGEFDSAKLGLASTPRPRTGRGLTGRLAPLHT